MVTIIPGDCREVLREMADGVVNAGGAVLWERQE